MRSVLTGAPPGEYRRRHEHRDPLEPGRETRVAASRERLVSGPLAWVFLSSFAALISFDLMLSVTPMYAAAGAGSAGAGLVTGVLLLGTVAAELVASMAMKRFRYRTLLIAGAALMGIPALALLSAAPLPVIAAVIDRMPASGPGAANALWNLAYDAGYGAGPVVVGLFAGHTGYPVAFALTGLLMLVALPAGRREHAASPVPRPGG